MKRKTTIITEEFDEKGILKSKTTETTEEEDNGFIYPQKIPLSPIFDTRPICSNVAMTACQCENE